MVQVSSLEFPGMRRIQDDYIKNQTIICADGIVVQQLYPARSSSFVDTPTSDTCCLRRKRGDRGCELAVTLVFFRLEVHDVIGLTHFPLIFTTTEFIVSISSRGKVLSN